MRDHYQTEGFGAPSPAAGPLSPATPATDLGPPSYRESSRPVLNASQVEPSHLRRKVVDRLGLVGRRHARHLSDLHGTSVVPGPHVVVFFYSEPVSGTSDQVRIATRMFLHGDDVTDLPTVLRTLHQRGCDYRALGMFDPRLHMTNRVEPMSNASAYLGVGTSTVDQTGPGAIDSPWHGLARLTDGTQLILARRSNVHAIEVQSTHTLDTNGALTMSATYTWRWATPDPHRHDAELTETRDALDRLHDLVTTSHAEPHVRRRAATHQRGPSVLNR